MKKYVKSDYSDIDRLDSINYQSEKEFENLRYDIDVAVADIIAKYQNHFGAKTKYNVPDNIEIVRDFNKALDTLEDAVESYIVNVCKLYE